MRERLIAFLRRLTPSQRRAGLFAIGPLVLLIVGGAFYLTGGGSVSSNNAYLKASRVQISTDVAGRVVQIFIRENEHVDKGRLMFDIDKAPFEIAVARAEAQLLSERGEIAALVAQYREMEGKLAQAHADLDFAEREYARQSQLATGKVISTAKLDQAKQALGQSHQVVTTLEQNLAGLLAQLGGDASAPVESHPRYRSAQATLEQARLDLSHASVHAPADGIVSQLDRLRPGDYVQPGAPLFVIVETGLLWVEANLKETELEHVRPGQSTAVHIDSYPNHTWLGHVESIGAATGAEFAILPPQNATGNWIKVTQRVPVRIRLEQHETDPPLRLGMSAKIKIDTESSGEALAPKEMAGTPEEPRHP